MVKKKKQISTGQRRREGGGSKSSSTFFVVRLNVGGAEGKSSPQENIQNHAERPDVGRWTFVGLAIQNFCTSTVWLSATKVHPKKEGATEKKEKERTRGNVGLTSRKPLEQLARLHLLAEAKVDHLHRTKLGVGRQGLFESSVSHTPAALLKRI